MSQRSRACNVLFIGGDGVAPEIQKLCEAAAKGKDGIPDGAVALDHCDQLRHAVQFILRPKELDIVCLRRQPEWGEFEENKGHIADVLLRMQRHRSNPWLVLLKQGIWTPVLEPMFAEQGIPVYKDDIENVVPQRLRKRLDDIP